MANKNEKRSFVMYNSFLEAMKQLNDAEFRECVLKIRDYALEGVDEESQSPYVNIILAMAKPNLDSARRRYMASVENGKKGFSSSFSNSSNSVLINEANDSERLKEKEERKEPHTEEQPSHSNASVVGVAEKGKGETPLYSKDSSISSAPLGTGSVGDAGYPAARPRRREVKGGVYDQGEYYKLCFDNYMLDLVDMRLGKLPKDDNLF